MEYVRNKPLGFQKENITYFPVNREIYDKKDVFKNKILQLSSVNDFSYSASVPGLMGMTWGMNLKYKGKENQVWFHAVPTSSNFIDLMGMKILKGRNFIPNDSNDIGSVVINQAFAEKFGLKKPFEARLTSMGKGKGNIAGIVKDFNFEPLYSQVNPLAFFYFPGEIGYGVIKINSSSYKDIKSVVNNFKSIWKKVSPDFPVEYNFLDENLARQYKAEERFETVFFYFSLFAIFIACLGLFGLTAYVVEQKTKEISIRKILGATIPGITAMLSRQFILLILLSNIIAWPVAYYITNNWLNDFAYRININIWFFILSALIALIIALFTVISNTVKAATANPFESLRYE